MTGPPPGSITSDITQRAIDALIGILDRVPSPKSLILDHDLSERVSLLVPFSTVKSHGVESIVWLSEELPPLEGHVVYLCGNKIQTISLAARHAKHTLELYSSAVPEPGTASMLLAVAPRNSSDISLVLTQLGIFVDVEVVEWPVYFGAVGSTLSLMAPQGGFTDSESDGLAWTVSQALANLEQVYGPIARFSGFGPNSKRVFQLVMNARKEARSRAVQSGGFDYHFGGAFAGNKIDQVLLIDRQLDPVTPLLTQLTYHGLLSEVNGIAAGVTETKKGLKVKLDGDLFNQTADLNFADVGRHLNGVAKQLQVDLDKRHEAKTVAEIKDFVARTGDLQATQQLLKAHTALAEGLMEEVKTKEFKLCLSLQQSLIANEIGTSEAIDKLKELMNHEISLDLVLRLSCLICICRHGIRGRVLHTLYELILKRYGYEQLSRIMALESRGLLYTRKDAVASFSTIAKSFNMLAEGELGRAYSGYIPLSAKLTQWALGTPVGDSRLLGEFFDETPERDKAKETKLRRVLLRNTPGHEKPVLLVILVGGVTFAEAASINDAVNQSQKPASVMIASSGIINGNDMVA